MTGEKRKIGKNVSVQNVGQLTIYLVHIAVFVVTITYPK